MTSETGNRGSAIRKRASLSHSPAASSSEWNLVSGVTPENYYAACKSCFAARGTAFLVALGNGKHEGVEYSYSAKQWGAWLAFFKRTGIKTAFMLMRDWYQVPTEWPHQFTSDSTVQQDHDAGSEFERRLLSERAAEKEKYARTAAGIARVAAAMTRLRNFDSKKEPTPPDHLVAPEIKPPWHTEESWADFTALKADANRTEGATNEMDS